MRFFVLLTLSVCSAALGDTSVSYFPYDFCDTTTHKLAWAKKGTELRLATARVLSEYLCGEYMGPIDVPSGYSLHIFPDGSIMLVSFSDIGPTKLVAEGKWAVEGNVVRIVWSRNHLNDDEKEFFRNFHGNCKELFLYLLFDEKKDVRATYLVSHDKDDETIECPMYQSGKYVDWPKIKSELSNTRK